MAGLKSFLGTDGILRDEEGNQIFITDTDDRDAIVGEVIPVDIGTRPNANDGDPLRTSFSKLNNFVLASYQNDSDVQERVSALEAGAVFLGVFQAGNIPRRYLPDRNTGAGGAWTFNTGWPTSSDNIYHDNSPESLPDLFENPDATPVYAMISRSIEGRPELSVVIDDIEEFTEAGTRILDVELYLPDVITPTLSLPSSSNNTIKDTDDSDTVFPSVIASVTINNGDSAETIVNRIQTELENASEDASGTAVDYFTFEVSAPTEDTRSLLINYNFKGNSSVTTKIPSLLAEIRNVGSNTNTYANNLDDKLIFSGNTSEADGIEALPWFDQDFSDRDIIPAYTIFQWSSEGWTISGQGQGDIKSEFLFFEDDRTDTLNFDKEDVDTNSPVKILTSSATQEAIIEVQQFGIDYVHNVTIDAGEY